MNIKEIAIQCGVFNEASILNEVLFDRSLEQFAQAVIAAYVAEQKPVAWMNDYDDFMTNGRKEAIADTYHNNISSYTTPLFTLEGVK